MTRMHNHNAVHARPDEKMGTRLGRGRKEQPATTAQRAVLQRSASKKRRQRDRP